MSWIRDGVITLTNGSKAVTGTGTTWLANVVASSGLKTPTGIEEIESVSADGALQLVVPYTGPSVSNVAYAIIPTQGLVPTLAQKVGTLLTTVGVMKDDYEAGNLGTDLKAAQLTPKTGASKIGADAPVAVPFLQTVSDIINGNDVSLFRFVDPVKISDIRGFSGTYDAASALRQACTSGAKRLTADYGLWNLESSIDLQMPVTLEGAGDGTVFHQRTVTTTASLVWKSISSAAMIDGIRLKNFVMQSTTGAFAEQQHLIAMSGVRNAVLEGLRMYGFRGDAVYFGSGGPGEERHNEIVRIAGCVFDGVNNENRNAISVIDVDGMTIENSAFLRCTRPNMPGPIDFEPNANAWHILRNVTVRNNRFRGNGGNVGEIAVPVPGTLTATPRNFTFESNDSDGYVGTGAFVQFNTQRQPSDTSEDSRVRVIGNRARNGFRPYAFSDGKGVELGRNVWQDFKQAAILGSTSGATGVRDVESDREKFVRVGSVGGVALAIFNANRMKLKDAQFIDCGTGNAGSYAIDFGAGSSSYVDIDGLRVSTPTGKTLIAIQKEAGHTFNAATNRYVKGDVGSLGNFFAAHESDTLETAWSPVISGSGVEGAGTYPTQFGRFRIVGKELFYRGKLVVAAGHTGTGVMQIHGFPVPVRQSGGTAERPVNLTLSGVGSTGGQTGLLFQAIAVGGVTVLGVIRCFSEATGTLTNIAIPAGTFTVYFSGSYLID